MATKKIQVLDSLNKNAVMYTPQDLTEEQKAQARENINVPSLIDGKIPIELLPDNIGGDLTEVSWDDIKDRPFYEKNERISIVWDGNIDGLTEVKSEFEIDGALSELAFYKMSDAVPTMNEILGSECSYFIGDGEMTDIINEGCPYEISDDGSYLANDLMVMVCLSDGVVFPAAEFFGAPEDIIIPESGIWFTKSTLYGQVHQTKSLVSSSSSTTIKQLDKKFIPSDIGTWAGMPDKPFGEINFYADWDISNATAEVIIPANEEADLPELKYYKIAEPLDGSLEGYIMAIDIEGSPLELTITALSFEGLALPLLSSDTGSTFCEYVFNIKNDNEIISLEHMGVNSLEVSKAGLYLMDISLVGGNAHYLKSPENHIKKIDKKYLPDDIGNGGNADLSDYYNKSETDILLSEKADLVNGKIPTSQLPIDLSGGNLTISTEAIVDVISLPIEDIKTNVFYRLLSAEVVNGGSTSDGWICHCVDGLPEIGEPCANIDMTIIVAYYNIQDNNAYVYVDEMLSMVLGVPSGWHDMGMLSSAVDYAFGGIVEDEIDTSRLDKICILLKRRFYIYQNGWTELAFGYNKLPEFDISWDGVAGDRFILDLTALGFEGTQLVKVSDDVFTAEQIIGATYSQSTVGRLDYIDSSFINDGMYPGALAINGGSIMIVHSAELINAALGLPNGYITTGVYFVHITRPDGGVIYTDRFTAPSKIVKIDNKYLDLKVAPQDCPYYSGGYIIDSNCQVLNYYEYLIDYGVNGVKNLDKAIFNIPDDCKKFSITFSGPSVNSDSNIVINIVTGHVGDDLTGIDVELQNTKKLNAGSWYTVYCIYEPIESKWVGFLTNSASDTSKLEDNIRNLESQITEKQSLSNLVTSIDLYSTDDQYPSAKLLYNIQANLQSQINTKQDFNLVTSISSNSTDSQYPSAKLLYDIVGDCDALLDEIAMLIGE